jgi:hypothetical protein
MGYERISGFPTVVYTRTRTRIHAHAYTHTHTHTHTQHAHTHWSDNCDPINGITYGLSCESPSSHGLGNPKECFKDL